MNTTLRKSAAGVAVAALVLATPVAAQTAFDGIPGLTHYGDVNGWQVKKLDSDDIWYGQACILFKDLTAGANPAQAVYRFEPGEEEVTISFRFPQLQSVRDRDAVDWGRLQPTEFQYVVNQNEVHDISGHIGFEYIDARTVYVELSLDADADAVNRMASSDQVGVAVRGQQGLGFPTGRATRAVGVARRFLASFR